MDMLPEVFNQWLLNYGNLALFGLLALGIIALPVPEETLLIFTGFLISQGTFSLIPTVCAAFLGSVTGITVSYLIGHIGGLYVVRRYGPYVGLTEAKLTTAHDWFEKYGKWVLFIGYFIPGLRHFTGVFAGVSDLQYRYFATFAYLGAFFWVLTFLCIGYFFGNYHQKFLEVVEHNAEFIIVDAIVVSIVLFGVVLYVKNK